MRMINNCDAAKQHQFYNFIFHFFAKPLLRDLQICIAGYITLHRLGYFATRDPLGVLKVAPPPCYLTNQRAQRDVQGGYRKVSMSLV